MNNKIRFWSKYIGVADENVSMLTALNVEYYEALERWQQFVAYKQQSSKYNNDSNYTDIIAKVNKYGLDNYRNFLIDTEANVANSISKFWKNHFLLRGYGKLICLDDCEKYGVKWICNEVITATIYDKYNFCNNRSNRILYDYIRQAEYICNEPLMDKYKKALNHKKKYDRK
jgi:hypothetical protein